MVMYILTNDQTEELRLVTKQLVLQMQCIAISVDTLPEQMRKQYKSLLMEYIDADAKERQKILPTLIELLNP